MLKNILYSTAICTTLAVLPLSITTPQAHAATVQTMPTSNPFQEGSGMARVYNLSQQIKAGKELEDAQELLELLCTGGAYRIDDRRNFVKVQPGEGRAIFGIRNTGPDQAEWNVIMHALHDASQVEGMNDYMRDLWNSIRYYQNSSTERYIRIKGQTASVFALYEAIVSPFVDAELLGDQYNGLNMTQDLLDAHVNRYDTLLQEYKKSWRPQPKNVSVPLANNEMIENLKKRIDPFTNKEQNCSDKLGYKEFQNLIKKGVISKKQTHDLLEYAETIGSPILFRPSSDIVRSNEYAINLLWILKDPVILPKHICGLSDENLNRNVIGPILDWRKQQPHAHINFWYDSEMLGQSAKAAVTETKNRIAAQSVNVHNICFRNIRDLPIMKENPFMYKCAFSCDTPIYFRVDFAKVLTGDHVLRNERKTYVINADSDIVAVTKQHLFNARSMHHLKYLGYLFSDIGGVGEENSFIVLKNTPSILNHHKDSIIERVKKNFNPFYNKKASHEIVFLEYPKFREAIKNLHKNQNSVQNDKSVSVLYQYNGSGFPIIGPRSQFGCIGGYTDVQIQNLKTLLPTYNDILSSV